MFATLLGPLPRPPLPDDASTDALVEAAIRAQESAGLDPVTDGGFQPEGDPLRAWESTARLTDRSVKHVLVGPYSQALTAGDPTAALALADRPQPRPARARRGRLPAHRDPRTGRDPHRGGRRRACAFPRRPPSDPGRRQRDPPVAGHHRWQRQRRRDRDLPRGAVRQPGRGPRRRTRQLVPRRRHARRPGDRLRRAPGRRGFRRRAGDAAVGRWLRRLHEGTWPHPRRAGHRVVVGAPAVGGRGRQDGTSR